MVTFPLLLHKACKQHSCLHEMLFAGTSLPRAAYASYKNTSTRGTAVVIPLTHLSSSQSARIVWLAHTPDMERRLLDLGFEPGEVLTCVLKGRKGAMSGYLVKHAVIALRSGDAGKVFVSVPP